MVLALRASAARAGCNIIPPVQAQAQPSTLGSVASPITTALQQVEIQLVSECDATEFDPDPSKNDVSITFPPAGPTQPPAIHVVPDSVECTAGGSP
ncbi:MAG TPA: hypothetical protein VMS22_07385, partial [Candidatus Eisenbacteria bacterium]|nr:hypothetical protein [Candidatus Eisenbacteria bacterium]